MAVKNTSAEQEFLTQIEKHKGILFKISKMYMDDAEDQKDLFQEITYQAWKSLHNFRGESQFSTWVYRIALNTAIIFLKKGKRKLTVSSDQIENFTILNEESNSEKEENLSKMYAAINQLNNIDKALIFYYLENFSGKEIAEEMGITEVNVRVKLNRAKTKLKELLNQN
ncbi:RNA polymerase sigma factor [Halpernia frigidisoli]|uniref:RNA polymerase sigma-70 factor, ECF subfamily n=1 Tax=Halpernia frigidisoli TaxID=1125876 RepID=A0A1I3D8Z0_9FLAO|nr:sigma-70 family RNA polymerase sigma factor [Halpernia frigidisoli]SFH83187.1 RNA polymerase sigma-70 factor, ECF subfamily [Halpernia frigidisoli]